MSWILLSLLFVQVPAPDSPIIFPDVIVPAPKPINLDLPIAIKLDELYVVQSDTELFIRQSPKDRLSIEKESGPIKVRGKFVGSNDKSKTFTKKFVYIVTVTDTTESGLSDLFFVPKGVAADKEIIQRAIDAQVGPRPPPDPPGPKPKPDPEPAPAPQKLFVSIWYTKSSADPKLAAIIDGEAWRSYCSSGGHGFRVYSDRSAEPEKFDDFKKAFETAGGLPCVVIQTKAGVLLTAVKVPDSEAKLVELLKKWGG